MSITEELQRVRGELVLPDDIRLAIELRRELERQGVVKPPQTQIIRQTPAENDKNIRVFYR